jgi:hypothetical protein
MRWGGGGPLSRVGGLKSVYKILVGKPEEKRSRGISMRRWEDNIAVIAQTIFRLDYGLDDRGSRVQFPAGAGNFSLHHRIQNGSGVHTASYPVGTRCSFPGIKRPGREADHSHLVLRLKND